jgi:hypothetical protein
MNLILYNLNTKFYYITINNIANKQIYKIFIKFLKFKIESFTFSYIWLINLLINYNSNISNVKVTK